MNTYCSLLQEIKYRTEAIDSVLHRQVSLRQKIGEELCYLQLRLICELVAIGCLVLHGNLKAKAQLYRTYKADWIINELAKLHPKFFPDPLENEDVIKEGRPQWIHKPSDFLTQDDLSDLWAKHAGPNLHRGNAKSVLVNDRPLDFVKVQMWRDKIVSLMNRHVIVSADEEHLYYFVMKAKDSGKPVGNLFQRLPDGQPKPLTSTSR